MILKKYIDSTIYTHTEPPTCWQNDGLLLSAEPHVKVWQHYHSEARESSIYKVLHKRLVQLQFPIRQGISHTAAYHAATKQGLDVSDQAEASGLILEQPDELQLHIYQSAAGDVPVLIPATRADFCTLVQALAKQNEPVPIPDSMGACMIGGYNNWDRIHAYRQQWLAANPQRTLSDWPRAFQELIPQKPLFQDRFIILSRGPYSHVDAESLGLAPDEWLSLSLKLRLGHECAHYFTKRVFGIIRQHLHDELLADYAGIVAASGSYRADWFLHFMGLEAHPHYRPGGRLENYLDQSLCQEPIFTEIRATLVAAAHNLELFDSLLPPHARNAAYQGAILCALASTSLSQLAAVGGDKVLAENVLSWHTVVSIPASDPSVSQTIYDSSGASSFMRR